LTAYIRVVQRWKNIGKEEGGKKEEKTILRYSSGGITPLITSILNVSI